MKRILWLSNVRFSSNSIKGTGTWLQPLAKALTQHYAIFHICCGTENAIKEELIDGIKQYVLPNRKCISNTQIPDKETCKDVASIIKKITPDMIHVWGTEAKWAYMKVLGVYGSYKTLLDIQGLLQSCYEAYYGGLTTYEKFRCLGKKEILLPSRSIYYCRTIFKKKAIVEGKILGSYDNISYQSDWVRNRLLALNLKARLYSTKIIIRSEFFQNKWKPTKNSSPIVFTSSASATSYKGLHVLLKTCSLLKKKYPHFRLYIAGRLMIKSHGVLSGYESYLLSLVKKYKIEENIIFLGPLSIDQMISYQLQSDMCVVPSFVESYCLGLAESLALGLPSIAAYSAAMPTIAADKEEVIFYNPMDYADCAAKIIELFESKQKSLDMSLKSIKRRLEENEENIVVETQKNIYESIIGKSCS